MHDITITIQSTAAFEYFNRDQNVDSFNLSSTVIVEFFSLLLPSLAFHPTFRFHYLALHQLSHPFHFSGPSVTDLTYLSSISRLVYSSTTPQRFVIPATSMIHCHLDL